MIGTIITLGIGAIAFKIGMNTQKRSEDGASCGELVRDAAYDAAGIVGGAAWTCYDTARRFMFGDEKDRSKTCQDNPSPPAEDATEDTNK